MKEVKQVDRKIYTSKHANYLLSFIDDKGEKRKFEFEKGLLELNNAADIRLVDEEFNKRYLVKDGDLPRLDENGKQIYAGDIKFIPIDEYEKARLSNPIQVKAASGKTYVVSEQDIINMINAKESGDAMGKKAEAEKIESDAKAEAEKGKLKLVSKNK